MTSPLQGQNNNVCRPRYFSLFPATLSISLQLPAQVVSVVMLSSIGIGNKPIIMDKSIIKYVFTVLIVVRYVVPQYGLHDKVHRSPVWQWCVLVLLACTSLTGLRQSGPSSSPSWSSSASSLAVPSPSRYLS